MNTFNKTVIVAEDDFDSISLYAQEADGDEYEWEYRIPGVLMYDDNDGNPDREPVEWRITGNTTPIQDIGTDAIEYQKLYRCRITKGAHAFTTNEVRLNYGLNN